MVPTSRSTLWWSGRKVKTRSIHSTLSPLLGKGGSTRRPGPGFASPNTLRASKAGDDPGPLKVWLAISWRYRQKLQG